MFSPSLLQVSEAISEHVLCCQVPKVSSPLLQVAGERKAEIEALLRGTAGAKPQKQQKQPEAEQRPQETDNHRLNRHSFTKRWRKTHLKKKSIEEEESSIKSSTSSSTTSSNNSSIKSTSSCPSSQDGQIHCSSGSSPCSNGHVSCVLETINNVANTKETSSCDVADMSLLQRLALNALNLAAPASSVLLRDRRNSWVQLAGHPGSLAPAGPGTIWKKRGPDPVETQAYQALATDPARDITPTFFREIIYQEEYFIEMRDLLYDFHNPCVMDIKMGTRTFLESEVSNKKARKDLYEKMIKVDVTAPNSEECEAKAVTKLRYMDFRDNMSSSRSLGFRIEALKMTGSEAVTELQTVRSREEVVGTMSGFLKGRENTKRQVLERLAHLRDTFRDSPFFQRHEVIGSSILIIYDDEKAGVWMIDFAKTVPIPEDITITHRKPWELGNHEEGYLTGIDNLIKVVEEVPTKTRRLGLFHKS
ncbi:inositol-trisphosphate 3-kinase homolog isoform X2 [Homarus americanus]|uniref:inositol-trisphosphate 3-kinase homolog isoform X2 n=1 Tax=Homarus americanus TaxID=6706 RepID=UPI001C44349D|nr:inositol-trisphosphate 3-kinase homolog isoform X2 [Homarus americanus]